MSVASTVAHRPGPDLRPDDACAFLFPGTGAGGTPDLTGLAASGQPARTAAPEGAAGPATRIVADVLDAVTEGLPPGWPDLRTVLLDDPAAYPAAATRPGVAQAADYACAVAADRVLRAGGVAPAFAVGQSFGEIAAMVSAGVFTITDGARMAVSLVQVLTRRGAGGGLGLIAAPEADTRALLRRAADPSVVVACTTAPALTVVAGPDGPLDTALAAARDAGRRAVRLAVPYLSHHPAMAGADAEWYDLIRAIPARPAELPVLSPVRGRAYTPADDPHRALADCIVRPLRLPEILRAARRAGATVFVQAGPGDALCHAARLSVPGARTFAPMTRPRPTP
ncbi:acyltransferase domain-containing protein [Actinomadura atramentaria]|uniref:acyltransferase domain-containing protein n=1 Tax=Actinomadura atramentaria TaxID=1990 RepID=UPI000362F1D3|nr:acyltransferase domain-containing protein [Actinomadura atramentaria]